MKYIVKQITCIAILIIIINMVFITPVHAMGDVITSGRNFLKQGNNAEDMISIPSLQSTSNFIFNMFLVVAIVLAVGIGAVLGVKFITSSAEGQAKIKEAIVPYIVGCIVIFAAFPLWSFFVNAGQNAVETITYSTKYCKKCGDEFSESEIEAGRCSCGEEI